MTEEGKNSLYRMMTVHAIDDMYSIHDGEGVGSGLTDGPRRGV